MSALSETTSSTQQQENATSDVQPSKADGKKLAAPAKPKTTTETAREVFEAQENKRRGIVKGFTKEAQDVKQEYVKLHGEQATLQAKVRPRRQPALAPRPPAVAASLP